MSHLGYERRFFCDVRDESGLPQTPERLRQRSEPTFRAMSDRGANVCRKCAVFSGIGRKFVERKTSGDRVRKA
jgi:hypothetical protein